MTTWDVKFLQTDASLDQPRSLIILNQPFTLDLIQRVWQSSRWRACADGGANRLYDTLQNDENRVKYLPDLIKGDLDSLRLDVREFYTKNGVPVVKDEDQDSTDLMKCVQEVDKRGLSGRQSEHVVLLGGLSGRLDQTIHTLSYLHKLRKTHTVFAVTDDNVGWVLDSGEHDIEIDHSFLGQTCGLLPVGVAKTVLSTRGLRWNLDEQESSFGGLVSTSNHLVPGENVWVKTTDPIWWTMELKPLNTHLI
ncbi:thiamine pyrophosphokinase Thi80 [Coprinopsis marcescibilis]|uniref:Thiamine pyrophosphokinase n=1 Tax=Coprinopsis marcescibilis TaxID=230819 RepID=A0A5C3L3L9_COPMA|nr:thiamine pyrophosphokinase Thi80 [Coprinopsis marcescibilis]